MVTPKIIVEGWWNDGKYLMVNEFKSILWKKGGIAKIVIYLLCHKSLIGYIFYFEKKVEKKINSKIRKSRDLEFPS